MAKETIVVNQQNNVLKDFELFVIKFVAEHPNTPNPKLSQELAKRIGNDAPMPLKHLELVTNMVSKVLAKEMKKSGKDHKDVEFYNSVHHNFLAIENNRNAIKKLFRMFVAMFFETNESRDMQFTKLIIALRITGGYNLEEPKEPKKDALRAVVRQEPIDGMDPIAYAAKNNIKIMGMDPIVYAHETQTPIEGNPFPLSWALIHNNILSNNTSKLTNNTFTDTGAEERERMRNIGFVQIENMSPVEWVLAHPEVRIITPDDPNKKIDTMKYLIDEEIYINHQPADVYAMEKNIPIDGKNPYIWVIENGASIENSPLLIALSESVKFDNENPLVWAMKNAKIFLLRDHIKLAISQVYTVDGEHPLLYAAKNNIRIAGDSPSEFAAKWSIRVDGDTMKKIEEAEKSNSMAR